MNKPEIIIAKEVIMSLPSWECEDAWLSGGRDPIKTDIKHFDYSFLDYVKAVRDSGLISQDILIQATKAALEELLNEGMLVCKHGVPLTAGARYSDTIEYKSQDGLCEFYTIANYANAETPEQFEAIKAEMWRTKPKQ